MGQFKKGNKVFDIRYGWGDINDSGIEYPTHFCKIPKFYK